MLDECHKLNAFSNENNLYFRHGLRMTNTALKLLQVSNSIYNLFIYGKMHDRFWTNAKAKLFSRFPSRQNSMKSNIKSRVILMHNISLKSATTKTSFA